MMELIMMMGSAACQNHLKNFCIHFERRIINETTCSSENNAANVILMLTFVCKDKVK